MDRSYFKALPRMYLNIFLADLLAFMMLALTIAWDGRTLSIIAAGVFPSIMLLGMNYNAIWNIGFKDPNSIKIYNRKYSAFKGEIIALLTLLPLIIFAVWGYLLQNALFKVLYNICAIFSYGFYVNFPNKFIVVFLIFAVIYILFNGFAYRTGYKQISLYNNVIFKKDK